MSKHELLKQLKADISLHYDEFNQMKKEFNKNKSIYQGTTSNMRNHTKWNPWTKSFEKNSQYSRERDAHAANFQGGIFRRSLRDRMNAKYQTIQRLKKDREQLKKELFK